MSSSRRKSKDPADCEDPACTDMADLLRKGRALAAKNKEKAATSTATDGKAAGGRAQPSSSAAEMEEHAASSSRNDGCPLDKGELGAATWGLIHTTAAHYPEKPSKETQDQARALVTGLAGLYPCTYCRKDFREEVRKLPPDVSSRVALSLWACQQHNLVNEKIGKPTFRCTLPALDERWKQGKPSCWEGGAKDV
ncbi:unnamed protein product [Ectocarpus sp. CCAP 1310/34]|nr:unnamed protein product [Ectocarpus sp. CCAP 1310/34]